MNGSRHKAKGEPRRTAVTVRVEPRDQIGCWAAIFRAKSKVFSRPHAGTKPAVLQDSCRWQIFFPSTLVSAYLPSFWELAGRDEIFVVNDSGDATPKRDDVSVRRVNHLRRDVKYSVIGHAKRSTFHRCGSHSL